MRTIVVREGEGLPLDPGFARSRLADRLLRISDSSPFPIFRRMQRSIRAAPVVGTITCGAVRIEIRPKTSSGEDSRERSFLLDLLRCSGYLSRYHAAHGSVHEANGDPIDALIAEIVDDIALGLHGGVPRRYETVDVQSTTIRGRIDFTRMSTRLPCTRLLIPLRYAPLTVDNRLARMIKWTALSLSNLTRSVSIKERLSGLLVPLQGIHIAGFSRSEVDAIALSRFEMQWKRILVIARQLARGRSVDPTIVGDLDGTTFVFPLERLFERCLRRLLSNSVIPNGLSVSHRTDDLFMLESRERRKGAVRIRPDFVYRKQGQPVALGDAKWKVLTQRGATHGLDADDIYQVCAYLMRYRLRDAFLFFPKTRWMPDDWSDTYVVPETAHRLHLVGVDVEALVSPNHAIRDRALSDLGRLTIRLMADGA